jgi:hypothetical protein
MPKSFYPTYGSQLRFSLLLWVLLSCAQAATQSSAAQSKLSATASSFPVEVMVQSPADTNADLQVICLFRSDPANTLSGSLADIDQKLGGLLTRIRKGTLFAGTLGETLLIVPAHATLQARRVLLIGIGDRDGFTIDREQLVGSIVFEESALLRVDHPFFAPTVLDGGKTGINTGDVAEQFMLGFLRAQASEAVLRSAGMSAGSRPKQITFLAGAQHAADTRGGIEKALKEAGQ